MPENRRFVIGDIHGCIRTLKYLVENVLRLEPADTLFLLGDIIDRGPGSKEVINYIMALSVTSTVRPVMGNHEFMMLRSLEDEDFFYRWTLNGCAQTLISFGVDPSKVYDRDSVFQIPQSYFDFFRRWPLYEETDDFFFVHAGLDAFSEDPLSDVDTLLWTRNEDAPQDILKGRKLIHGHTPVSLSLIHNRLLDPEVKVLNLDGGCVYNRYPDLGNPVALDLDQMRLHSVRNRD
jgi:serine/threonine protein phosphatase 1